VQTAAECLDVAAKGQMGIFQPERKRITKTKDSLTERDEFEPSDDLVSIAGISVCTGVAFTVG
jgi:hypothetical protein